MLALCCGSIRLPCLLNIDPHSISTLPLVLGVGHARSMAVPVRLREHLPTGPDFVEPYPGWAQEDGRPLTLGVMGAMIGLALVFVIARVYCRIISLGRLGMDDYIVVVCIVSGEPKTRYLLAPCCNEKLTCGVSSLSASRTSRLRLFLFRTASADTQPRFHPTTSIWQ
jgi:hypothetical protein